jgi:hypothetical protein
VVICSVVGFLGLLSAATGFGAEGTRIKVNKNTACFVFVGFFFFFFFFFFAYIFFNGLVLDCRLVGLSVSSCSCMTPSPLIGC